MGFRWLGNATRGSYYFGSIPDNEGSAKDIDDLLMESESLSVFVKNAIFAKSGEFLNSEDVVGEYEKFVKAKDGLQ